MKESNSQRIIGIDLLKIISMYMITIMHTVLQGGILSTAKGGHYWIAWFLETAAYCSVNCFAIISGYVGWKTQFTYKKLLVFWRQVVFYTISITVFAKIILPEKVTGGFFVLCFIPITSQQYWYATAYFGLMILIPILNLGIKQIEKAMYTKVVLLMLIFMICIPSAWASDTYQLEEGYSLIWLCSLYILGAYLNKYDLLSRINKRVGIGVYLLMIAISMLFKYIYPNVPILEKLYEENHLISYVSPTIIIAAIALVSVFEKLSFSNRIRKIILTLSPAAFGVYLLHTHPIIWDNYILGYSAKFAYLSIPLMIMSILGSGFVIFAIGIIVEMIRIRFFNLIELWVASIASKSKIRKHLCK